VWPEFAQAGRERITVRRVAEPEPLAALTDVLAAAMPKAWSPDKA
jgi:hypothetical protein